MSVNRRRFFRVRAGLRFTFAWDGGFELFRTTDVSACGASVLRHVVDSAMPALGTVGECAFNLESMEIRCLAKVVRVQLNGFAVDFIDVERAQEDRICGWAFRFSTRSGQLAD
ncbi:MAG: PilZ domain-containing protein [Archangium sp.]